MRALFKKDIRKPIIGIHSIVQVPNWNVIYASILFYSCRQRETHETDTFFWTIVISFALQSDFAIASGKLIGISWANSDEEKNTALAALKATIVGQSNKFIVRNAESSPSKQLADINELVSLNVDALIIYPLDAAVIDRGIDKAIANGTPVIAYENLIESPDVTFITFDDLETGRLQARELLKAKPEGNYVILSGDPDDYATKLVRRGQIEVLEKAISEGKISIVGEAFTDVWLPASATEV